jgi:hypothetical protein
MEAAIAGAVTEDASRNLDFLWQQWAALQSSGGAAVAAAFGRSQHTLALAAANTQYISTSAGWSSALSLGADVRSIRFGLRGGGSAQLRYAFVAAKVATSTEPFALRPAGYYEVLSGGIPDLIYFATDTAGAILELEIERAV